MAARQVLRRNFPVDLYHCVSFASKPSPTSIEFGQIQSNVHFPRHVLFGMKIFERQQAIHRTHCSLSTHPIRMDKVSRKRKCEWISMNSKWNFQFEIESQHQTVFVYIFLQWKYYHLKKKWLRMTLGSNDYNECWFHLTVYIVAYRMFFSCYFCVFNKLTVSHGCYCCCCCALVFVNKCLGIGVEPDTPERMDWTAKGEPKWIKSTRIFALFHQENRKLWTPMWNACLR